MNVELAVKSGLLFALVGILALALKGASAAVRHRVWAVGFLGLAVLPFLLGRVPTVEIQRPSLTPPTAPVAPIRATLPPATPKSAPVAEASNDVSPPPRMESRPLAVEELLLSVWILGFLGVAAQLALLHGQAALIARRGIDLAADPAAGVPPHTRVLRSDAIDVPMTCGFLRPTILLPLASTEWSETRLRAALLHEGAHVRRGDWAWLAFTQLLCAAYWFNPLVWWGAKRMRGEAELAADDAVLRAGMPAPQYAESLVEFAADLRNARRIAALPIVERGTLKARIEEILRAAKPRGPLSRRMAVGGLSLGAATVAAFAATQLVPGPVVVHDGILDLAPGEQVEIAAITEMRKGGRAVSWDIHGALLPDPMPVDANGQSFLTFGKKESLEGKVVRYVILRGRLGADPWPSLSLTRDGESLTPWSYSGPGLGGNYFNFRNAAGGSYLVFRIVVPREQKTAQLYSKAWNQNWSQDAYVKFRAGYESETKKPTLGIAVNFGLEQGRPTKVSFNLPPRYADRQTRVTITPDQNSFFSFDGKTGPQTVSSIVQPGLIEKVEVLSRPLWPVVFADLPMAPDRTARYRPHRFEPAGLIHAKDGRATMPDGSALVMKEVSGVVNERRVAWKADGSPSVLDDLSFAAGFFPRVDRLGMRFVVLRLEAGPDAQTSVQEYFDGEGKSLLTNSSSTIFHPGGTTFTTGPLVSDSRRDLDLIVRVATGAYQTHTKGELSAKGAYRSTFLEKGRLRVDIPSEVLAPIDDQDLSLEPLDAKGRTVASVSYSRTNDRVEFDFKPGQAKLVKEIRIKSRPYRWVEFPNVSLYPRKS